jgi:hypothetical protein
MLAIGRRDVYENALAARKRGPGRPMKRGGWVVHSRASRITSAVLVAVAAGSLPAIFVRFVFLPQPPASPAALVRLVLVVSLLPAGVAWVLGDALSGDVAVADGELRVARHDLEIAVPVSAIDRVRVWNVPLPGPGFSLRTRAGRHLGLQSADPTSVLRAVAHADVAVDHPTLAYARARAAAGAWRWYHRAVKFPLFALGPTLLLFNAHQHIAYGAFFGEWLLLGAEAWARTLLVHWVIVTIYLVLWASVWRTLAEATCLAAARVAPSRAAKVRRVAETACRVLYWGGVPVVVAIRFLPW